MIPITLLPAGVAALGLALLDGRLLRAGWLSLRVALGVALWLALWRGGSLWLDSSGRLDAVSPTAMHALAVNLGLALAAALPPALILKLTAPGAATARLAPWHGLAWFAGLILPQIGQSGAWPPASVALALGCGLCAMALGALAGGR